MGFLNSAKLQAIKESGWLWFAGLLLCAFTSGFGAYPTLLAMFQRTDIGKDELRTLTSAATQLKETNAQLDRKTNESDARGQALQVAQGQIQTLQSELRAERNDRAQPGEYRRAEPEESARSLIGVGTSSTNAVSLLPSRRTRTVSLTANAEAFAEVGGWVRLSVSGTTQPCEAMVATRNQGLPEVLTSPTLTCKDQVPAGEARTYIATAPNWHATARLVRLEVRP